MASAAQGVPSPALLDRAALSSNIDDHSRPISPPKPASPAPDPAASRRRKPKSAAAAATAAAAAAAAPHARQTSSNSRGREFRVGNVGGNGVIYLRPIKRSSLAPTVASSSAGTVGRRTFGSDSTDAGWRDSILSATGTHRSHGPHDSLASASPPPAPRTPKDTLAFSPNAPLSVAAARGPAKSSPSRGTFKVVIDRANLDDSASTATPLYDVSIPHYRLGTPHFTGKGSAVLHSSINTGSSAVDSERVSEDQPDGQSPDGPVARTARPRLVHPTRTPERVRPSSQASSEPPALTPDRLAERRVISSSDVLFSKDPQKGAIGTPDVRVSPVSGQILAASIPQLIVHITSPYRLDYDLLSDFFLTFRLFMPPSDLATQLLQRLKASVRSGDGMSRIVRVRTFVALRHWILNYFVDDFVSDMQLRIGFCEMVNGLCRDVRDINSQTVGDLRILGELKRCWKHTCALFWDVPMDPAADHMEQDIYPGGMVGSRSLPPDQTAALESEMRSRESSPARVASAHDDDPVADGHDSRSGHSPTRVSTRGTQAAPHFAFNQTSALQSSTSLSRSGKRPTKGDRHSMQVLSCTIPSHSRLARQPSKGPRPVQANGSARSQSKKNQQAGETPRRHHKRSGSFSDALRDDRAPLPAPQGSETGQSQHVQMIIPGSLIRGAMIAPAEPYVESVVPRTPAGPVSSSHSSRRSEESTVPELQDRQGHFNPPGVRRFIGSVRRALSVRNHAVRPMSSTLESRNRSCSSIASRGPYIAAPLAEPGVPRRELVGGQTRLRVDLLAAEISESFKAAVQEASDAQREAALVANGEMPSVDAPPDDLPARESSGGGLNASTAHDKIHSTVTMGSRSIIIADDTNGQVTPRPDVTTFHEARTGRTTSSARGVQDVPVFLDTATAASSDVYIDGQGNTIPVELVQVPRNVAPRASQLSTAHNLHDVTAVSLQERNKLLDESYAESMSYSDNTSTNDPFHYERVPAHQLRRVPGGDLKAAQHVHSLDSPAPGTLPQVSSADATRDVGNEQTGKAAQAGLAPLNSQPMLRPSFEKEVAKLADIPDPDPKDAGGIESALRRLEGREASLAPSGDVPSPDVMAALAARQGEQDAAQKSKHARTKSKAHREDEVVELPVGAKPTSPRTLQNLGHRATHAGESAGSEQAEVVIQSKPRSSVSGSEASHSSVPLLERGTSHPPRKKNPRAYREEPEPRKHSPEEDEAEADSEPAARPPPQTHESFLLDDDQSLSSLSATTPDDASASESESESDSDGPRPSTGMRSFFQADDASVSQDEGGGLTPRAAYTRPENPVGRLSTAASYRHERSQSEGDQPQTSHMHAAKSKSVDDLQQTVDMPPLLSSNPGAAHMCFVLAYDSQLLAQQFTVVERDALSEVEWRDLIDLRWNQSAAAHSNWVDFLRAKGNEASFEVRAGVDMCIARFNLVVRWAKSEIVLTEDVNERAATVTKYIRIAQHCRRLRNWATMYQLTMALVGSDISRLKATWDRVAEKDKELLNELEELIVPTKNFHNLREEIESATETFAQDGDGGCIPFIGIYTHDLIYNAQKPMYVATGSEYNTTPSGYPHATLVNFERHHTAATIVKNLLRLIEASSKYAFQPLPEIASRCLWIGALTDDEVSQKSLQVEPARQRSAAAVSSETPRQK